MNKSMLVGSVLGAVVATAGGAIASYSFLKKEPEFAQVVAVQEIKEPVKTPRQECRDENVKVPHEECHDVSVTHQRPVQDSNRVAGTVLGAVIGGALGHQVGSGRGKDAATVVGAAAGGYAGNQVQKGMQRRDTYTTTERRCNTVTEDKVQQKCETVYDLSQKTVGYDVTYKLGDAQNTIRMDHNPGDRIPVKNGILVLNDPNAPQQPGTGAAQPQPITTATAQ
ncbi:MAG TPA: glycine zipper 2TM domain-containing protein [Pseudomonadales bacterium]|nr:glycine zipper 2TM domain-containing protein [Pseudomonadales bacterium]